MSQIEMTDAEPAIRLIAKAFAMDEEQVLEATCSAYQGYIYDCHECHQEDGMMSEAEFSLCNVHTVIDDLRSTNV
jgi:hypothetical protein